MRKGKYLLALFTVLVQACAWGAMYYVDVNSAHPVSPYTNWANAAVTIQDAVDVASDSDEIVVAQGTYRTGTRFAGGVSNRVMVLKAIKVQSISGPDSTIIEGIQGDTVTNAVRCAYLANGASLIGFTLSNGSAPGPGGLQCGGVVGQSTAAWLSNCVIVGNSQRGAGSVTMLKCSLSGNTAFSGGQDGGGAFNCVLTNCSLSDNWANHNGGGAAGGLLSSCVLSNNSANSDGGGVNGCGLFDCRLFSNSAPYGGGCSSSFLTNCTLIGNSAAYGGGATSSILTNCMLIANTASQNGGGAEASTLISCVLISNAALYGGGTFGGQASNCVFNSNLASAGGGGAYLGTLRRCVIVSNSADFGGGAAAAIMSACAILTNSAFSLGGGVADGALDSCVLLGNTSTSGGGAALFNQNQCVLNNCTLIGNYATNMGGGAFDGTLNNCIIYYNDSPTDPNLSNVTNVNYCCTAPVLNTGVGNITNAPSFVNLAAGNFDLPAGSPLINAGLNAYVTNNFDYLGRPRVSGGVVDIGAYEFQSLDAFHAWLQQFGLPTDGTADYLDSDADGMNNWQEWIAGTIPTNAASVLRIQTAAMTLPEPSITMVWLSTTNRSYFVQRSTNLSPAVFATIQTNIPGASGTITFTDTNSSPGRAYYRVGVHQ